MTRSMRSYIDEPTKYHKEIAVAAAQAKKHIFCEKPMAMNEEECDEDDQGRR